LRIDASPRRLVAALPALLGGTDRGWLASAGYHREDAERIDVTLNSGFILDGEMFEGGEISLRQGAAITFVVP
jgi:diacylglycerol kinase (ATP)